MKRSLAYKLVLAFLLVSVIGAVLSILFARWTTVREFDRLVLEQVQTGFLADATAYYQANGSWQGASEHFPVPGLLPPTQDGGQSGPGQPPLARSYIFALADLDGQVVLPAGSYQAGDLVPADELAQGVEVEADGQVVGMALLTGEAPELSPLEEQYLARTNQSSLVAALAAAAREAGRSQ